MGGVLTTPETPKEPLSAEKAQFRITESTAKGISNVTDIIKAFKDGDADTLRRKSEAANITIDANVIKTFMDYHRKMKEAVSLNEKMDSTTVLAKFKTMDERDIERRLNAAREKYNHGDGKDIAEVKKILSDMTSATRKHEYFEYKYIEMNIFILLFVKKIYATMDGFVGNIMTFNKISEEQRKAQMNDFMKAIIELFKKETDVINPQNFDILVQQVATKFHNDMETSHEKLRTFMVKSANDNQEELKNWINGLDDTVKSVLRNALGTPQQQQQRQQDDDDEQQDGGFVRQHVQLPKAFYELNTKRT